MVPERCDLESRSRIRRSIRIEDPHVGGSAELGACKDTAVHGDLGIVRMRPYRRGALPGAQVGRVLSRGLVGAELRRSARGHVEDRSVSPDDSVLAVAAAAGNLKGIAQEELPPVYAGEVEGRARDAVGTDAEIDSAQARAPA